jgi:hypothetical protein
MREDRESNTGPSPPPRCPHQESSLGVLRVKEVRFRYAMGAGSKGPAIVKDRLIEVIVDPRCCPKAEHHRWSLPAAHIETAAAEPPVVRGVWILPTGADRRIRDPGIASIAFHRAPCRYRTHVLRSSGACSTIELRGQLHTLRSAGS